MAEDTAQERTEEATPRRREKAREEGQVARSRELNTMVVMLASVGAAALLGGRLVQDLARLSERALAVPREVLFDPAAMPRILMESLVDAVWALTPFLLIVAAAGVAASVMVGGLSFTWKAVAVKWEKLDPVKGLKRVFGARGFMELAKALAKFALIGALGILFLVTHTDQLFGLGSEPVEQAMGHALHLVLWSMLVMSGALVIVALVDVPFQLWQHGRQLRMTRQEVKDENKETEGSPEVRGQIRRLQREMAERRMMAAVPEADVVITNPEHYAVALRYDQATMRAPVVVAKGADLVAQRIREVARAHDVVLVSAPPLARALYHSTELEQEIPAGLYVAVAQVLAYVFQLKGRTGQAARARRDFDDLPIPDDLRRDD